MGVMKCDMGHNIVESQDRSGRTIYRCPVCSKAEVRNAY